MKLLISFILVILIGFIALFVISTPQIKKLSLCLETASEGLSGNIETATKERWSRETVCMNGQAVIEDLQDCYDTADSQTLFPNTMVESLAKLIRPNFITLSKSVEAHNIACVNFPNYQVKLQ